MSIREIITELKELEQEIRDLKRDKAQVEAFCAAIVKKHNEKMTLHYEDLFKSDYKKVRLFPIDETNGYVKIIYVEDYVEDEENKDN